MCFSVVNRLGVMVAVPFGGKVLQMWRFSLLGSSIAILAFCASQVAVAIAQSGVVEAATTLFKGRKFSEAESLLRQALSESPSHAPALVLLGRLRATVGHVDEAEVLYKRALKAFPRDASAHHALAKLFAFQQRWKEAKESFEQSLQLDADNAEGWLGIGRVAMTMGEDDVAKRHYEKSLSLDGRNALLYFDMGVLNCKKGHVAAADEAFLKASELNPRLDLAVVVKMFMAYGMLDQAKDVYTRLLQKEPDNPVHLLAYGELCEALKNEDEALDAYELALTLNPVMGKAHLRKAFLLTGTGLTNQAAVNAFGVNAEKAKFHLREATKAGEEEAAEALKWCEMEENEAREWRQLVRENVSALAPSGVSQKPGRSSNSTKGIMAEEGTGEEKTTRGSSTPPWVEDAGGYRSVAEVDILDGQHLMKAFVNQSRPVVIKNFQSGFAEKEAWSWTELSQRFGDSMVRVSLSENGRFDGPEDGSLWGLSPGEEVLVRPPATSMAFSDFVRLLKDEEIKESFYIEYLAVHQYLGEQLKEMIPLPSAAAESDLELLLTNLWAGKGGTTAVLHYDDYENLLCQIRGTKELILFPPKDLKNLYYQGRRKGKLQYSYPGKWRRGEMEESRVIFSSSVRLDDPDFDRHPRLKRCRPYRVILREGDVLYMPASWHHEVQSFPDENEGNIAVNFWFRNVTSFAEEEREVLGIGQPNPPDRAEL